jgi:hypothetical protein
VPDDQFLFALTISDQVRFDAMLDHLAACVLEHVGYAPPAIADILGTLRGVLEQSAAEGRAECDVQFRTEAGQLLIVVSNSGSGRERRVARALPD